MEGERPNTKPTPDKEKPASVGRELLKGCLHLFWTWIGFDALAEDFATHENAVRKANVLRFLLVVSLLVGISTYFLKGCIDSSDIQTLRNDSMSNSATLDFYKRQGTEADKKLQQQAQDIQILHTENASLANQAAVAASIPLHVPSIIKSLENILATEPTNRQAILSLLYTVESLTNALADASLRPSFDLYINDIKLTNSLVLDLANIQHIKVAIRNSSAMTAEQLYVVFEAPSELEPTYISAVGWKHVDFTRSAEISFTDMTGITKHIPITTSNFWRWDTTAVIPGDSIIMLPPITISTNWGYSTNWMTTLMGPIPPSDSCDLRFLVYSPRAITKSYTVIVFADVLKRVKRVKR